jgi:sigma-B regulation protein RsbU (phosphoserine phosphatase)
MAARKDWPMLIQILQKTQESLSDDERTQIYNDWVNLSDVTGRLSIRSLYLGLIPVALIGVLLAWLFLRRGKTVASPDTKRAALSHSWPILVSTLAAVILVIFAALWSQSLLQERATRDVHNAIQTVLDTTSHAVTDWFREREKEVQLWANLDSVRGAVLQLDEASTRDAASLSWAQGVFHNAIEPLLVSDSFLGVTVVGLNGELLAAKNARAGAVWAPGGEDTANLTVSPNFVQNVLAHPSRVTTTMPTRSSDVIFHSIVFGTVIWDRQGSARAILALHVDPGQEFSDILQRGRIGVSGETYAINRFGQLISESRFDNDLIRIGLIDERGESLLNIDIRDPGIDLTKGFSTQFSQHEQPLTLMARTAVAGQDGQNLTGYNDYRGVPVVGAWLWDGDYAFGITTEMDVSEAYEFFQLYSRQLIIGTTLTILLILCLTLIFIRGRMQMAAANAKLETAYAIIKSHSERMEEELNVGRDIQMSMIPLTFPAFPEHKEFIVNARLQPAREVGGDFYDFYFSDDEHFCICIGDVSGKGVPSALFMAVSKTLIKSHASGVLSTANIITHVNDEVSSDNPSSMFVTVFIAIVNLRTGVFTCTNAGHNPPYVKRRDGQLDRLDHRHGPVIGALAGIEYGEHNDCLHPGDQLILYTDGVTEAINNNGELYSEDRLVATLQASGSQSSEDVTSAILDAVEEFEKGTPQTDDITVLAFEYLGDKATDRELSWQRTIRNDITEIPRTIQSIETFCRELPVPIKPTRKLKIVFDEILNNIISYGYTDEDSHQIEIEVDPIPEGIVVRITDDGIPFNPLEREKPSTDLPIDDREIGGLGVHLVMGMVDELIYERRDDLNVLRLVLHFSREDANLGTDSGQSIG